MTRATTRAIVALTPNPALDRTLWLDRALEPGALHRVQRVREAAGGKGVNLARAVAALGGSPVVAGPVAGFNGRKFRALLQREGIAGALTEVAGETRECTIVLGGAGHPTEINEAGPDVDEDAWRELLAALPEGRLVVAGSLPPGIAPSAFGE
ncbi:MAG: PfkB family carbohydrate kinase, partial [Deinococcales bacterium]